MTSRKMILSLGVVILAVLAVARLRTVDRGQPRFFADQTYHFQTLRALSDVRSDGADTGEVLATIKHIRSGDAQGWYAAWQRTGDRTRALADTTHDRISRGRALLRAHNYYRTAEFFLPPNDPKRPISTAKNTHAFYEGLDTLEVSHERILVPYEAHHLNAVYYPGPNGAERKPLIVFVGGIDSTLEELYFALVADALEHGYSVLTYEGPGQGSVIREQGLPFTHEWEKPTRAVVDTFLAHYPKPSRMVLVGMSLGGYLAPRAAAFDDRFDGVVAFDVMYDMGAVSSRYVPAATFWLEEHGLGALVDALVAVKSNYSPGFQWAVQNGMWVMGTAEPLDTLKALRLYTLEHVAGRITGDVLILAGEADHFVPMEQVAQFQTRLIHARSVTSVVCDRESGGAEHCQLGATTLWHATFFDWMADKFAPET